MFTLFILLALALIVVNFAINEYDDDFAFRFMINALCIMGIAVISMFITVFGGMAIPSHYVAVSNRPLVPIRDSQSITGSIFIISSTNEYVYYVKDGDHVFHQENVNSSNTSIRESNDGSAYIVDYSDEFVDQFLANFFVQSGNHKYQIVVPVGTIRQKFELK